MADVTGILLDGWFLNKPELSTALPARVLEILNEWHDSNLDSYEWDFPESLPEPLQEVYAKLYVNLSISQWCWNSSLWNSLNNRRYPTRSLHIFPIGSLDSRMEAVILARRAREIKNVSVHKSLWPNNVEVDPDALIPVCAKRTWEWLTEQTEAVTFNLTLSSPEVKRAYRWIAALAANLSKDIKLLDWDEAVRDLNIIELPLMDNEIYCNCEFLRCYLLGESPNDEHIRNKYFNYKVGLDENLNEPTNDKIKLVLETWLEWKDEEKNILPGISTKARHFLRPALVE